MEECLTKRLALIFCHCRSIEPKGVVLEVNFDERLFTRRNNLQLNAFILERLGSEARPYVGFVVVRGQAVSVQAFRCTIMDASDLK